MTAIPKPYPAPRYAKAGRVCHTFALSPICADTRVMDDFGTSVQADPTLVLFYVRGDRPSFQTE